MPSSRIWGCVYSNSELFWQGLLHRAVLSLLLHSLSFTCWAWNFLRSPDRSWTFCPPASASRVCGTVGYHPAQYSCFWQTRLRLLTYGPYLLLFVCLWKSCLCLGVKPTACCLHSTCFSRSPTSSYGCLQSSLLLLLLLGNWCGWLF